MHSFSLDAFKVFSLSVVFIKFDYDVSVRIMSTAKFWEFSAIISFHTFSAPLSFSSFWDSKDTNVRSFVTMKSNEIVQDPSVKKERGTSKGSTGVTMILKESYK